MDNKPLEPGPEFAELIKESKIEQLAVMLTELTDPQDIEFAKLVREEIKRRGWLK